MVQILDMSHKMFYTEIKDRESILKLINSTVSHELRNPLSAIIGQTRILNIMLQFLASLIQELQKAKIYGFFLEEIIKLH